MDKEMLLLTYEELKSKTDELRLNIDTFMNDINDIETTEKLTEKESDIFRDQYWILDGAVELMEKVYQALDEGKEELLLLMNGEN